MGLIKFRGHRVCQRQFLISFFNIKYFHLSVNRDGIKEEKVGQLFSSKILAQMSTPIAGILDFRCF